MPTSSWACAGRAPTGAHAHEDVGMPTGSGRRHPSSPTRPGVARPASNRDAAAVRCGSRRGVRSPSESRGWTVAKSRIVPCRRLVWALALAGLFGAHVRAEDAWVSYPGADGPGRGKRVVLVSGDEEYRSEEALPQLAKILARRHGFKCTVLFAVDPDGTINPNRVDNIPASKRSKRPT